MDMHKVQGNFNVHTTYVKAVSAIKYIGTEIQKVGLTGKKNKTKLTSCQSLLNRDLEANKSE